MPKASLQELLDRNQTHVDSLAKDHFADVQDGQAPAVVSVCCSDSRVSQEAMFDVDEPGWLFTAGRIGNQATDIVLGQRVIDGNLLYPVNHTDTRTIAVVGHTGCGAVTAAYQAVQGEGGDLAPGISKHVTMLEPIVDQALEHAVDETAKASVVDQLVEANVHAQVDFLLDSDEIPEDANVYGFVYDLHGTYGQRGRTVLVNANGARAVDELRELVPDGYEDRVASLL